MYTRALPKLEGRVATQKSGETIPAPLFSERTIIKGGHLVDPYHGIDQEGDIAILGKLIIEIAEEIKPEKHERVIDCRGLYVFPGLIDMHLHIHDLFEVSTRPADFAVSDGVTLALSPGAGNTFLAPALLGAEMDRGFPLNAGLFLGAGNVLACSLNNEELIALFRGELKSEIAEQKLTRNAIANATASLTVGVKEHMGHAILRENDIERLFEITDKSKIMFMSHTQDIEHAVKLANLSSGRKMHMGHTSAVGCGTESSAEKDFFEAIELCKLPHISGEFVSTMMRKGGGNREGLRMTKRTQQMAYDALEKKVVDIIVSDGQSDATMKGFGDTRDNLPAIFELAEEGILSLIDAVATMTKNPAKLFSMTTENPWWEEQLGNLGVGTLANITIADPNSKRAIYTIVNGCIAAFESRAIRSGYGLGKWIYSRGVVEQMGVGDFSMYQTV